MAARKTPAQPKTSVTEAADTAACPTEQVSSPAVSLNNIAQPSAVNDQSEPMAIDDRPTVNTTDTMDVSHDKDVANEPANETETIEPLTEARLAATTPEPVTQTDQQGNTTEAPKEAESTTTEPTGDENKAPTPEEVSAAIIKTHGLDDLDYTEYKKLMNAMQVGAQTRKKLALRAEIEALFAKVNDLGATRRELADQLKATQNNIGLRRGPTKQAAYIDSAGQKPQVGVPYKNPKTGNVWTKVEKTGGAKKEFLDLLKEGYTWAQLEHHD